MTSATSKSLLANLRQLWRFLSARRRRQLGLVAGVMVLSSLAEMLSLGAIVPFLAVLAQPERLWINPWVQYLAPTLGWTRASDLVIPICLLFALTALISGGVRILSLQMNIRLANAVGSDLSSEVYHRTLYQPYTVQVSRNSSEVITAISNQVNAVISILTSLLQLITGLLISLGLVLTLVAINPEVTLGLASVVGFLYALIINRNRLRLAILGQRIVEDETRLIRLLQEGLGAIRDVLLDGSQSLFVNSYRRADRRLRRDRGMSQVLALAPRYGLEAVGMALIALTVLVLGQQGASLLSVLPLLGVLALGAQRLLPTLQLVYGCWVGMNANLPALQSVLTYLSQPLDTADLLPITDSMPYQEELRFERVSFRYGPEAPWVLHDLNLTIHAGERIGLIGSTGSGKSTCLDLAMGLLEPTEGQIYIDGTVLQGLALRAWRRGIAHVPQSIFLSDASIAENIAFGVAPDAIDWRRLREAAQQAQIADFIETLPQGYQTPTGERGVRLSGGQRQRIGIARALYRRASVLVLDEATSALDNATEAAVMTAIFALKRNLTVLIIAHRLTTLQGCDRILELQAGQVVREWLPADLLTTIPSHAQEA